MEQPHLNQFITEFYARIEYERGNIDYATMVKLVNTTDLKSVDDTVFPVQVRVCPPNLGVKCYGSTAGSNPVRQSSILCAPANKYLRKESRFSL